MYRVPASWSPHLPTCTADRQYVAFAYAQNLQVSAENGRLYSSMGERFDQRPVERDGPIEYYNCFIRSDGTWIRQYLLPGRRPGHIQSNTSVEMAKAIPQSSLWVVPNGGYVPIGGRWNEFLNTAAASLLE